MKKFILPGLIILITIVVVIVILSGKELNSSVFTKKQPETPIKKQVKVQDKDVYSATLGRG